VSIFHIMQEITNNLIRDAVCAIYSGYSSYNTFNDLILELIIAKSYNRYNHYNKDARLPQPEKASVIKEKPERVNSG